MLMNTINELMATKFHCVKSVRIRGYSGPYFPSFGLKTERFLSVFSPNERKYGPV